MKSNIEGITEQSGIYAGKEGYDIQVKTNTRLKGAVIESKAEKEKNRITTGTLTWENIDNKAEYKASKRGLLNTPILSVKGSTAITAQSAVNSEYLIMTMNSLKRTLSGILL